MLEEAGFETRGGDSVAAARAVLEETHAVDCVVSEYELPDGTGLELIREVREATPDATSLLYTERSLDEMDTVAFGEVIAEYVPKDSPGADEQLVSLVEHSLAFRSQTAYPLPDDEDARLEALERYAEDPESLSDSLGRLTELATALFGVNSAAVGLVDDHEERFLSCYGANFDTRERDRTLCTHTILEEGVMVVEDATEDPRFESLERLERADVRFYAGAPVRTPEGLAIGVFCLHDDEPRTLSDREREQLTLLAEEAMEQLELRRQLREEGGA